MEEGDTNRPSLGFPVGLVLLLFMLFTMSGLFSCCLHWEKVLSLLGVSSEDNHSHIEEDVEHLPQKSAPPHVVYLSFSLASRCFFLELIFDI